MNVKNVTLKKHHNNLTFYSIILSGLCLCLLLPRVCTGWTVNTSLNWAPTYFINLRT